MNIKFFSTYAQALTDLEKGIVPSQVAELHGLGVLDKVVIDAVTKKSWFKETPKQISVSEPDLKHLEARRQEYLNSKTLRVKLAEVI